MAAACQASLSITNSRSSLKLMSIESVMPSNHLSLCCPLLLPPSIFPSIRVFSNESVLHIRWPKYPDRCRSGSQESGARAAGPAACERFPPSQPQSARCRFLFGCPVSSRLQDRRYLPRRMRSWVPGCRQEGGCDPTPNTHRLAFPRQPGVGFWTGGARGSNLNVCQVAW